MRVLPILPDEQDEPVPESQILDEDEASYDWQRVLIDVHLEPEENDFDLDSDDDDDFLTD